MSDEQSMLAAYRPLAMSVANRYWIPGAEREDVEAEAMVGLLKAVRTFDPARGQFGAFAWICIEKQVQAAATAARRLKHRMLTDTVRDAVAEDGHLIDATELVAAPNTDPAELLEQRDLLDRIVQAAGRLSDLERAALAGSLNGVPYMVDGVLDKQTDNALQRARRKLSRELREAA